MERYFHTSWGALKVFTIQLLTAISPVNQPINQFDSHPDNHERSGGIGGQCYRCYVTYKNYEDDSTAYF